MSDVCVCMSNVCVFVYTSDVCVFVCTSGVCVCVCVCVCLYVCLCVCLVFVCVGLTWMVPFPLSPFSFFLEVRFLVESEDYQFG